MDAVVSFLGGVLRMLAFHSVFYVIGNVVLKVLTLGRYPRVNHLRQHARQGFPEFELVMILGLVSTIGIAALVAKLLG